MFDKQDDQSDNQPKKLAPDNSLFSDQLKAIVNESGTQKYADMESALAALKSSQEFIPKLESDNKTVREELETLRAELAKRSSVEDVVAKLMNKEGDKPLDQASDTPSSTALDKDSVQQMLSSLLEERDTKTTNASNKERVKSAFLEKYGDTAGTKFGELAKSANMSAQDLEQLASTSPELVLRLIPETDKGPKSLGGGYNTGGFNVSEESTNLQPSAKSVLAGSTAKDLRNEMLRHKELVYKRLQVTI